jgi:hypothetical protein
MAQQIQNDPIYTLPFLYKNGLTISNDATTPHTILDIAAGQCRDSNDVIDIVVGNPNLEGGITAAPLLLNAAVNGVNGLDTGSLGVSMMYAIYMIADSRYYQPVACIATLATNSIPLIPFGYDSYRLIGYWATNASSQWQVGYYIGGGATLQFVYDAFQATAVTAGAATAYTAVNLAKWVPPVNNIIANIYTSYVPATAGNALHLQGVNQTGDSALITGQVATVAITQVTPILVQLATAIPEINYKVGNASDTVAIDVEGFVVGV